MPIDPTVAVGAEISRERFSWEFSDVLLYHLGIGAGHDPVDPRELRYVYEEGLRVLPTFGTVANELRITEHPVISFPGVEIDLVKVVNGRQEVTAHRPIPVSGEAVAREHIIAVYDVGRSAIVVKVTDVEDFDGNPLWSSTMHIFARGEGGFGGDRPPRDTVRIPERVPDAVVETQVFPQQALLFRLCGDRNPLHADPAFAREAGFERPILHGLGSYGAIGKAVTDGVLDGDADRMRTWSVKFTAPIFPGETVRTSIWEDGDRYLAQATAPARDDTVVLTNCVLTERSR